MGGTVSDSTGALIPGVTITATNAATGIMTTVISNESGAYQFASLQTGTYKLSAELTGFQTQIYNNVALGVSQQVRMNFTLQVGGVSTEIEVRVAANTLISTTSSSVGTVLTDTMVRDLPLSGRNVLDLVGTTAGAGPTGSVQGYFAGGRISAVNTTRDGFVVSDGRFDFGAFSGTYVSPDLVEEVRVITTPVDAEAGRGAGQVQMATRGGTNQFKGSIFWTNHNSALDASNWFNNFNGVKKDYANRNQFGVRVGGPIKKNKTFFFVLLEEQRNIIRQSFVGTVLTEQARNGIYRFFPGADNGNITSNTATVDRNGAPVRPANATGDLQSFSVFGRDANRTGYDPTGFVQGVLLSRMPLPNDYTAGDGLNTAGIRFTRRINGIDESNGNGYDTNRDQFNLRFDHNFNTKHKLFVVYTYERDIDMTEQAGIINWPGGFYGANDRWPNLLTFSLVSTVSPNTVNEFRAGEKRTKQSSWANFYVGREGEGEPGPQGMEAFKLLPKSNGIPYHPIMTLFPNNIFLGTNESGITRWSNSPTYSFADTLSWTKGKHAFKTGGEMRFAKTAGGNDTNMTPQVQLGAGGVPVANIDNVAIPGLSSNNQTLARNLLIDLSGSVASIVEGFDIRDPRNPVFLGYRDGVKLRTRDWRSTELSGFFKDGWKLRPSLTVNVGIHWEWFGVPYEAKGLAATVFGRESGLCGISCGTLTAAEFVGKNSTHPDQKLHNDDWNNFAPSAGLSWSLPWFGKDKTVLRAGYGWSYTGGSLKNASTGLTQVAGGVPGTYEGSTNTGITYTQPTYLSLANLTLPIPHQFVPLQPIPLDGSRADTLQVYATNRPTPYVQNFNVEIQREVARNMSLTVSYVGTKGTKLWGGVPINGVDIFNNGFLDGFNMTRAGGNAVLFDQMLRGLNIPGAGIVNGTTLTGSAALRAFTSTRTLIANGNAGGLADFLNRSTGVTGKGGGYVRNSGLFPENFFVLNPQFSAVTVHGNPSNSTYHSLQMQLTRRFSNSFSSQTTYVWSRALGLADADLTLSPRDPRNLAAEKSVLGFHRTHSFNTAGTVEMPFGPNRTFLSNAPALVQRMVERWQLGAILRRDSGAPLSVTAPISSVWQGTANTPVLVGNFPKSAGKVIEVPGNIPTYFAGLKQITDPSIAGVSSLNGLSGSFSNKAVVASDDHLILVNPAPGQAGTLGRNVIEGPASLTFDLDVIKRVRIAETKEFEFRLDAVNVLNHPVFGNPDLNINSTSFGRINTASAGRRFTVNARLNF